MIFQQMFDELTLDEWDAEKELIDTHRRMRNSLIDSHIHENDV